MRKKQIDLFLKELDKALHAKAEIILTGASAGSLMGHIRPSFDIDFEIRFVSPSFVKNKAVDKIILETARKTGVAVNFSENVGHWSMISFLNYRKTAVSYQDFGLLKVKLMAPEYWTIGKMARYYVLDAQDMAAVIRKKRIKAEKLVRLWRRALEDSGLSLELGLFKKHAVHFLRTQGKKIWGKSFQAEPLIKLLEGKRHEKK